MTRAHPLVSSPSTARYLPSYPRRVGGVPRGSFAFSDAPPSAARPLRVFVFFVHPRSSTPAIIFLFLLYFRLFFALSIDCIALCGFLAHPCRPRRSGVSTESQPSVNRLHRFPPPPAACSRARCAFRWRFNVLKEPEARTNFSRPEISDRRYFGMRRVTIFRYFPLLIFSCWIVREFSILAMDEILGARRGGENLGSCY